MTNTELVERYPFLIPRNRWTDKIIEDYDPERDGTELDGMLEGWRIAFGEQMCEEILQELIKWNFLDDYRILQVKEKWGGLRWYDNGHPIGTYEEEYIEMPAEEYFEIPYPEFYEKYPPDKYYREFSGHTVKLHKYIDRCILGDIISKYEDLSERTCCKCGKPATKITKGWICPYCDDCFEKFHGEEFFSTVDEYYGVH